MKKKRGYTIAFSRLFSSVTLTSCFLFLHAQEFHIKTYTPKDGLSSSYILSTYQDKLGYLWISTPNGINRFDGKYFISYGFSEGLPDARTLAVLMDHTHRLWVGTPRGITELKGGKFMNYPFPDLSKLKYTYCLIETKKGDIIACTNEGVYAFRNSSWLKIKLYPGYENHTCRGIVEAAEGMYINYGSLLVLRKPDGTFRMIGHYNQSEIYYNNLSMSGGEKLVSTLHGLYSIEHEHLKKLPGVLGNLKNTFGYYCDSKKRFWIWSEFMGLQLVENSEAAHSRLVYKNALINLISGVTEDKDGNIWVADYEGLKKLSATGYTIYSELQITSTHAIRNVFQPPTGPLIVNDGTLLLKTYQNGSFTGKKLQLDPHSVLPNHELIIDGYAFDDKGRYWYYIRGFALAVQNGNKIYEQSRQLLPLSSQAFDVAFDKYRRKILVAVRDQKFPCQFDDSGYSVLAVTNSNIDVPGNIMKLHQCSNNFILFANDRGAIYSIDKRNNCTLQLAEFNSTGIVSWFCNDPSGDVWIVYPGRGLRRYRWQNGSLVLKEQFKKENGLPNDYICSLCFDDFGNLWAATSAGIAVLAKTRQDSYKIVRSFTGSDLQFENSEALKMAKDQFGNIWLASLQNVVRFDPRRITGVHQPVPSIQIENINLNLRQTDWSAYSDSLSGIFQLPKHLHLPYNENTFGIYFKGISSSGTDGIKYSYKLGGLGTTWSPATTNDFVSFVNLSPGHYVFEVKAQLLNTNWSEPAVFAFDIQRPFWETSWFRLSLVLLAAGCIVFIFRYRLNQLKMRSEMQNELRELEMKAFKLQMNPHFIHNALNSIQSLVINNKNNEASHYISKFAKLLRQVLENSEKNLISLDKELYSLQLYVDLEKLRMNMDVDYTVELDEAIFNSGLKIPPLLLQPFIENALWHGLSRKEGPKKIKLSMNSKPGWLICEITDNGIGRKKAAEFHETFPEGSLSKALNIIHQRLADFNQAPGFAPISFVDLEDNGEPAGTSVTVHIRM